VCPLKDNTEQMCTTGTTNHPDAIHNWPTKIGKVLGRDPELSVFFGKQKNAGFMLNESKKIIIGAKLAYLDSEGDPCNFEHENGDIIVSCTIEEAKLLDIVTQNNICENLPLHVLARKDRTESYRYKGMYTVIKKSSQAKYLIRPAVQTDKNSATTSSDNGVLSEEEPEVNPIKKRCLEKYLENTRECISRRPFYSGRRYDSVTEARYAVFMNYFQIPFVPQARTGVLEVNLNYNEYKIDYEVYPTDLEKRFFLEVKPFRPNDEQEKLCENVAFTTGSPVYIVYGNFGIPFSKFGSDFPTGYTGIRYEFKNNVMKREEGFVFADRGGNIIMDTRYSMNDFGFFTCRLKEAYEYAMEFKFDFS
jgi:hypothetical protein